MRWLLWCFCLLAESYETINHYHYRRYHYAMQPRAFGDIYCFPVPVAIGTDENLLQAKLAETSLLFSKFCNSSTNTFEINI